MLSNNYGKIRIGILRTMDEDRMHHFDQANSFLTYIEDNLFHKYKAVDIFVDKNNVWHCKGIPILPMDLHHKVDVIWNEYHSDLYQTLSGLNIPHITFNPFSYVLENNRDLLKEYLAKNNISTPRHMIIGAYQEDIDGDIDIFALKKAKQVFEKFGSPWIVKSLTDEKNEPLHVIKTYPELIEIIKNYSLEKKNILIEELITGRSIETHSIADFRKHDLYHLISLEKKDKKYFKTKLNNTDKNNLYKTIEDLHNLLGDNKYLKTEIILTPKGKMYLNHFKTTLHVKENKGLRETLKFLNIHLEEIIDQFVNKALKT